MEAYWMEMDGHTNRPAKGDACMEMDRRMLLFTR